MIKSSFRVKFDDHTVLLSIIFSEPPLRLVERRVSIRYGNTVIFPWINLEGKWQHFLCVSVGLIVTPVDV